MRGKSQGINAIGLHRGVPERFATICPRAHNRRPEGGTSYPLTQTEKDGPHSMEKEAKAHPQSFYSASTKKRNKEKRGKKTFFQQNCWGTKLQTNEERSCPQKTGAIEPEKKMIPGNRG